VKILNFWGVIDEFFSIEYRTYFKFEGGSSIEVFAKL